MNIRAQNSKAGLLPSLDVDLLKTFVTIVDAGSFSKAAGRVFRTPSAVSMQVKKLEELLGKPVFVRDSRSVALTQDGEILLGYAKRMLSLNDEIMARFLNPELSGTVRLGAPDDFGPVVLPPILKRFAESHPNILVDVVVDISLKLQERFERGELDLMLLTCPASSELLQRTANAETRVLMEEPLVWTGVKGGIAHMRNPLPVAMWQPGCSWRENATAALERAGLGFRTAFMSEHPMAQKAALMADLAVAPYAACLVHPPLVRLSDVDGLPDLGTYQLVLRSKSDAGVLEKEVAGHVAASIDAFAKGQLEDVELYRSTAG